MKVTKVEGIIRSSFAEVDKQPTIHVGLTGRIRVTLEDGRIFEDNDLQWDDVPFFQNKLLCSEEEKEISNQIEEYLINAAERIVGEIHQISTIVNETITEEKK